MKRFTGIGGLSGLLMLTAERETAVAQEKDPRASISSLTGFGG